MGNCQAAEAATVVIHHPGIKIERIYKSVSASEIMTSNPGHYVALVVTTPSSSSSSSTSVIAKSENKTPLKQLKLLRPNDILHIGQVYRLVSFEGITVTYKIPEERTNTVTQVLREFAAKKCVKLGRLLQKEKEGGEKRKRHGGGRGDSSSSSPKQENSTQEVEPETDQLGVGGSSKSSRGVGRQHYWRPALESIAEVGS